MKKYSSSNSRRRVSCASRPYSTAVRRRRIYESNDPGIAEETFTITFKNDIVDYDGTNAELVSSHGQLVLGDEVGEHRLKDDFGTEYYEDLSTDELYGILEDELQDYGPGRYRINGAITIRLFGIPLEDADGYYFLEDVNWNVRTNLKVSPT